ncbi:MAG: hypothetical protein WCN92_03100, partial [Eubacteriales bacterium]
MTDFFKIQSVKLTAAFSIILSFLLGVINMGFDWTDNVTFSVDTAAPGKVIGNKVSNCNLWSLNGLLGDIKINELADSTKFTDYIQLMTATGGNADRDLFLNPEDRTVLDDYDFAPLLAACMKILDLGAKPDIITGAVPLKLTTNPVMGVFGVNVYPPDDFEQYYTYMSAIAQALVDKFGRDEVLTWHFGVLTEYENKDWFMAKSGKSEDSMVAFCKLYDYTIAALQAKIGKNIFVGAHSMTVAEGLWDERDFIEHCANGTNYKTGEKGTRVCFLSASFYDSKPGKYGDLTLPATIEILRQKAESVGLNDLIYGVDEGRILSGTKGSSAADLNLRMCGFTYQAGYDARLIKQMVDNDIDYFSSWGYTTNGHWGGLPTVSFHVAERFSQMVGSNIVAVKSKAVNLQRAEIQAVAGWNSQTETLHIMAYNFKNLVEYKSSADMKFSIKLPQLNGKTVSVTKYIVDDNSNFFDDWQKDRKTYNITDDCFTWSPDDPALDTQTTLTAQWARDI